MFKVEAWPESRCKDLGVPKLDLNAFFALNELDADAVRSALLQKQYFPFVKARGEELPDLLTSESFSQSCASELAKLAVRADAYASWTELRTRRFDGLVRRLGIPHPVPYSKLVLHIGANWANLAPLLDGTHSQIKPVLHHDGRVVQMDYETAESSLVRDTRLAQGQRFAIKADISNCFPSIYSHSLDWATRGKKLAKTKGGNDGSWQADLDKFVRNCHDRETKGVMIGPAVSNLLSELVLQRIDEAMVVKGHQFNRYVDDYAAYSTDRTSAETFVVDLQHALAQFRLDLNTRKTRITDLQSGTGEEWMADVQSHAPAKWTPLACARFLRQSELLATRHPLHSVLKFAIKTMIGRRNSEGHAASMLVVDEIMRLCAFHPHLAPFLASELISLGPNLSKADASRLARVILRLLPDAAQRAETDVALWYLYILRSVLRQQLLKSEWFPLIEMDDDLVMLAVAAWCPRARPAVRKRVMSWDYDCATDYEQHWLVRYELNRVGILPDTARSAEEIQWMTALSKHNVAFSNLA